MKKLLGIVVLGLLLSGNSNACDKEDFIKYVSADERFIPLELFTGGEIRQDTEIKFTNANLIFG